MMQALVRRPIDRNDFEVAIICALDIEADAVKASLDQFWELPGGPRYGKASRDPNFYTLGRIGEHNVAIAQMPGMGKSIAAGVAASTRVSFPNIRLALVVGVCGGVPSASHYGRSIFLGDVVVSTGIVQYDFGRYYSDRFKRKDTIDNNLGRPNLEIRSFLKHLSGRYEQVALRYACLRNIEDINTQEAFGGPNRPPATADRLFPPDYRHKHQDPRLCDTCSRCSAANDPVCDAALKLSCARLGCEEEAAIPWTVRREATATDDFRPDIHFGRIASGDGVIRSSVHRDDIAESEQVIAFEMEGAGIWDNFPTIVIKGVCDYADSHKDKIWQEYAAVAAAACTKAILYEWRVEDKQHSQTQQLPVGTGAGTQHVNVDTSANATTTKNTNSNSAAFTGHTFTFNNIGGAPNIQVGEQTINGSLYFGSVHQARSEQNFEQH